MLETTLLTLEILRGDKETFPYAPTVIQNTTRLVQEVRKILEFRWFQESRSDNPELTWGAEELVDP